MPRPHGLLKRADLTIFLFFPFYEDKGKWLRVKSLAQEIFWAQTILPPIVADLEDF